MKPENTNRIQFRQLTVEDSAFVLDLYNSTEFIEYIGDRGIKNVQDARSYIESTLIPIYQQKGMGMFAIEYKNDVVGVCGLLKREHLAYPDLGYGFLKKHTKQGLALEAAKSTLEFARSQLKLTQLLAMATSHNQASINLLLKLGFAYQNSGKETGNDNTLDLYQINFNTIDG